MLTSTTICNAVADRHSSRPEHLLQLLLLLACNQDPWQGMVTKLVTHMYSSVHAPVVEVLSLV
jgi:hypothetical protein